MTDGTFGEDEASAPRGPLAPIVARAFVATVFLALVAAAAGYAVDTGGGTFVRMLAVMVAILVAGLLPIVRWTLMACRRAGYPAARRAGASPSMRRARLTVAALLGFAIVLAIVATFATYATTRNRYLEALVALANVPLAIVSFRRAQAFRVRPLPREVPLLRLNATLQLALASIFLANLALQLRMSDRDDGLSWARDGEIAALMAIVPIGSIAWYFSKRRANELASVAKSPDP